MFGRQGAGLNSEELLLLLDDCEDDELDDCDEEELDDCDDEDEDEDDELEDSSSAPADSTGHVQRRLP